MILYLDASALVKVYIDEADSDRVWDLIAAADEQWISLMGYAEVRAAFARRRREGSLVAMACDQVIADLDADWRRMNQVVVDASLAQAAGALADRHGLRGFDAVHLASALRIQIDLGVPVTLIAFDKALVKAARAEQLLLG